MPWYSVYNPLLIDPAVFIYIQEMWHFNKKPIVVVLEQGKLVNNNALHMLWIWGMQGFPFTSTMEEELWEAADLGNSIDTRRKLHMLVWWRKHRLGSGIHTIARKVAKRIHSIRRSFTWGKSNSNKEKQVRKIIDTIMWRISATRCKSTIMFGSSAALESMWHSKTQLLYVENDPYTQEINTLLSFDKNHEGWAVFCRGTAMAMAKGETILQCLKDFDSWKTHMEDKDFVTALNHHLNHS
ncbi:hypothetical protein Patl1_33300 [Pistacia atlantica]|uniref:Uncharacterized protein n=1 Tax=Pistacia atlantica TaxID=434234 RepID=A0ACC0ZRY7_9ROSI|nr:hypothetical protein Patl1_33300 [Pistacia atlantica]